MKSILLVLVLCSAALAEYKSYEGYKVYQVTPTKGFQLRTLLLLLQHTPDIDFWTHPRQPGQPLSIMVAPRKQHIFEVFMNLIRVPTEVLIENVQTTVEEERRRQQMAPKVGPGKISFTAYERYAQMANYLNQLHSSYPNVITVEVARLSFEQRPLYIVKISANPSANNPIILIDGGIHAREWIAPAMVFYIINQLVENPDNRDMIENVDWYIIPLVNPDGYEYTMTRERFWRKTRSTGRLCDGVDVNRNFDFHWMEAGASSNECVETYAGPSGFSEKETQFVRDQALKYADRIKLYLTFHSYGNYLLYPWGYTSALPDDAKELHSLAEEVKDAISSVNGTSYTIGSFNNVLYPAAGGLAADWMKGVAGVDLAYTIELPGGGLLGFDLPASEIMPVCVETFEGIKVYHDYIAKKFATH